MTVCIFKFTQNSGNTPKTRNLSPNTFHQTIELWFFCTSKCPTSLPAPMNGTEKRTLRALLSHPLGSILWEKSSNVLVYVHVGWCCRNWRVCIMRRGREYFWVTLTLLVTIIFHSMVHCVKNRGPLYYFSRSWCNHFMSRESQTQLDSWLRCIIWIKILHTDSFGMIQDLHRDFLL